MTSPRVPEWGKDHTYPMSSWDLHPGKVGTALSFSKFKAKVQNVYPCEFFLIFIFTLFYFTMLYWFCHTLTWIHHGCTCDPKHEPPSHLPPYNIPLGHPHAPAPSMLYPASDIDWWFNSYMIVYLFQCHSPKSSHPLPLSPKVHYTHLCLSGCPAYRVIIAIIIFLFDSADLDGDK